MGAMVSTFRSVMASAAVAAVVLGLVACGSTSSDDADRLTELEAQVEELESENARLKKLVANQAVDIDMLREVVKGEF